MTKTFILRIEEHNKFSIAVEAETPEEAEEIAALNLAKFRTVQGNLADTGERADLNEQALAKTKAKGRAGSVTL